MAVQNSTEEVFTVTNQLSKETPQEERKDPVLPEKPMTAYLRFWKEHQGNIRQQSPDMGLEEVNRVVNHMWSALDHDTRNAYEEKCNAEMKAWEEEVARIRAAATSTAAPVKTQVASTPPSAQTNINPQGTVTCIRLGCNKPSVRNIEWEDEYCSNQCVVLHCDYVFREWVRDQSSKIA
eukprot:TRINITY_DN14045_c0_g1_i1.p1 TRINITY_DN14045_c0_g1~~TRINITY_DN14045_c0_g1_i1.p1  ORF type:complete len:179 (-),score=18.50 TRINITY_DN14045_c0_g1_i1:182-718(-)